MNGIIKNGAMAQLVAHLHGMEGVGGSNPPSSTFYLGKLVDLPRFFLFLTMRLRILSYNPYDHAFAAARYPASVLAILWNICGSFFSGKCSCVGLLMEHLPEK